MKTTRLTAISLMLIGMLLVMSSPTQSLTGQKQPKNVQLTNDAWDAFNKSDYDRAIAKASECIEEFRGAADKEQAKLEQQKAPSPPTGKVSASQKQKLFSRGLLNDVATCFYIKGRSAEYLRRNDQAKEAYKAASKYTYARTWDQNGWFWSPSEKASERLKQLK